MENLSEYIVILWILPALLFVAIPLASLMIWLGLWGITHIFRTVVPDTTSLEPKVISTVEKRESGRFAVSSLRAEISDGLGTCNALVENISRMGLCLKNVPETLTASNALLSIVVRNQSDSYRIVARPKWEHWHPDGVKTIGAEIASHPHNWHDFVLSAS